MLEATMSYRSRWFEYLCYRPLIEEYYKEDPNMRWEAAPKPRLTDESYKPGYLSRVMTIENRLKLTAAKDFVTTEKEPLFDAAEFARFGKDIVIQHGFTANLAGIRLGTAPLPRSAHSWHEFSQAIHILSILTAPSFPCGLVLYLTTPSERYSLNPGSSLK